MCFSVRLNLTTLGLYDNCKNSEVLHQVSSDTRNSGSSLLSAYELCNCYRAEHTDSENSTQLSLGAEAALKSSSRLEHYGHFAEKLQIYFPLTINLANLSTWLNPAPYCSQQSPLLTCLLQLHSAKPVQIALYNHGVHNQQGLLTVLPDSVHATATWVCRGLSASHLVCAMCH